MNQLRIKISLLFNLELAKNIILSCFFYFFLIIDSYFLISTIIAQIFNPIIELVIPIEIPIKEVKAEMATHRVIEEPKIRKRKCSM